MLRVVQHQMDFAFMHFIHSLVFQVTSRGAFQEFAIDEPLSIYLSPRYLLMIA